ANHASPLVTLEHPLRGRVIAAMLSGDRFGLPTPVITEVVSGFLLLPRSAQNQQEWDRLRPGFRAYSIDEDTAITAAHIRVLLRRQGRQLQTVDALVAAVALRERLVLLTTDRDFDAVPELYAENWLKSER
ncbi:MAG: type II toxin-antitoxin system VapC family toxin, partial [Chloroflexota bacterium]